MSKRNRPRRRRPRRGKRKIPGPIDYEGFSAGPLVVERIGSNIYFSNRATSEQYRAMREQAANRYPTVCAEIDRHVQSVIAILREVNPLSVLHRSFWASAMTRMERGPCESQVDMVEVVSSHMLDYVQSLIVALVPTSSEPPPITDDQYSALHSHVDAIIRTFNREYVICRSAALSDQAADPIEHFRTVAELHWCNVCCSRYAVHTEAHLRALLSPQDDTLRHAFGIGSEAVIIGVLRLQSALVFRNPNHPHLASIDSYIDARLAALKSGGNAVSARADAPPDDALPALPELRRILCQVATLEYFDVRHITEWPEAFITALSASSGSDPGFLCAPEAGWPSKPSRTTLRPFLEWNGKSYLFSLASLIDHTYRAVEAATVATSPSHRTAWERAQKAASETSAVAMLTSLLPGAAVYPASFYLEQPTEPSSRCEADAVLVYDDCLIALEVKAGRLTHRSPGLDQHAFRRSIEKLVWEPIFQAHRLLVALRDQGQLTLISNAGQPITTLRWRDYRFACICAVSLDPVIDYLSGVPDPTALGIPPLQFPVWPICLDDLRIYTELFDNPLCFLDYLHERVRARQFGPLSAVDEFDHFGAHLKYPRSGSWADDHPDNDSLMFHGFRDQLDEYYAKGLNEEDPCNPPAQPIPSRFKEMLNVMARDRTPGRVRAGRDLLDGDFESRTFLAEQLETTLAEATLYRRTRPLSTQGGYHISLFASVDGLVETSIEYVRTFTLALMQIQAERSRTAISLRYDANRKLVSCTPVFLSVEDIHAVDDAILRPMRFRIQRSRRSGNTKRYRLEAEG